MNDDPLLDNIAWHTLAGSHRHWSVGDERIRRYAPGFSPIIAFADPARPDFDALAPHCGPGERFYCDGWSGPPPAGWQIEAETTMSRMVWAGGLPESDSTLDAVRLGQAHAARAVELATLTRPGPFALRTLELGEYFGVFDGDRLVAMAGERMHAGPWREISGVCTHPDHQGRGLARRLVLLLVRRELARGETPCLHVMNDNTGAKRLYARMGFRTRQEPVVRVVTPG